MSARKIFKFSIDKKFAYRISYLLIAALFFVAAIPVFSSDGNLLTSEKEIIAIGYDNLLQGSNIKIILNLPELQNISLRVISPNRVYRFDSIPAIELSLPLKSSGKYIIEAFNGTILIDSMEFYTSGTSQQKFPDNNSINKLDGKPDDDKPDDDKPDDEIIMQAEILTDKQEYKKSETVFISIKSNNLSDTELVISSSSRTYRMEELFESISFIPKDSGFYELSLIKNNLMIANASFYVGEKTEPIIPEQDDSALSINKTDVALDNEAINQSLNENSSIEGLVILPNVTIGNTSDINVSEKIILTDASGKNISFEINYDPLMDTVGGSDLELEPFPQKSVSISALPPIFSGKRNFTIKTDAIKGMNVKFTGVDSSKRFNLKIDSLPKGAYSEKSKFSLREFAIDPTEANFEEAEIKGAALGTQLWKCPGWNFTERTCYGSWHKIMDLIPGQEYSINISHNDPAFVEVGVASINTEKSLYHPGESVKLTIVALDKFGYLSENANVTLSIISPNNITYELSTDYGSIIKKSKGIYEATFSEPQIIGEYSLYVLATGQNLNQTVLTNFEVRDFFEFDIIRKMPHVIDPWHGTYEAKLNIIPKIDVLEYSIREKIPESFDVFEYGNAVLEAGNGSTYLIWSNLTKNSLVSYRFNSPKESPALYEIGPSEISYGNNIFEEARPWFIAIDPRAVSAIVVYKDTTNANIIKYALWNSSDNTMGIEQSGPNLNSVPAWQKIRCLRDRPECLYLSNQLDNSIDFLIYYENNNSWSNNLTLGVVDNNYVQFDVECEDLSGNCLIVYETVAGNNNQFSYRIYNATSGVLSGATAVTVSDAFNFEFRFINLYPKYGSNDIGIVLQNEQTNGGEYEAAIWNGTAFDNWQELFNDNPDVARQTSSCAWEGVSGELMCFLGRDAVDGMWAYEFNGTTWNDLGRIWNNTDLGAEVRIIDTCGETPVTGNLPHDKIIVMSTDQDSDRDGTYWNGTELIVDGAPSQDSSTLLGIDSNAACQWEHDGNTAVLTWADAGAEGVTPEWGRFLGATDRFDFADWQTGDLTGMSKTNNLTSSMRLILNPENDQMLFTSLSLSYGAVSPTQFHCTRWTGTTFDNTSCGMIEPTVTIDTAGNREYYGYASLDYSRYNAPPNISSLNFPQNGSNISSMPINFNFTVSDDIGLANCSIYLNNSGWSIIASSSNIENNIPTNISYAIGTDGAYEWNVFCIDNSNPSKSDWFTYNYTFTLDKTPPIVQSILFSSVESIINTPVNINATIVDMLGIDRVIFSVTLPNSTTLNYSISDPNFDNVYLLSFADTTLLGTYNFSIFANDTLGNSNITENLFFNVTLGALGIATDKPQYVENEYAVITGRGFIPGNNISLSIFDPSGDPVLGYPINATVNATGNFEENFLVDAGFLVGIYALNATDLIDSSFSANATLEVVLAVIEANITITEQGSWINISGYQWDPGEIVEVNITNPNGDIVYGPSSLSADLGGFVSELWFLDFDYIVGEYTIFAYEPNDPGKYDQYTFSITQRQTFLQLDRSWVRRRQLLNATGSRFSNLTSLEFNVYDETGAVMPDYPVYLQTNESGEFNYTINTDGYEIGNYTINATDATYEHLSSEVFFAVVGVNISTDQNVYDDLETVLISGLYWDSSSTITLDIINSSGSSESGYPKNVTANAEGVISSSWTARAIGFAATSFNVSAYDFNNPTDAVSLNITVLKTATIATDKNYYLSLELVNISGRSFSPDNNVSVSIFSVDNGGIARGYPRLIQTDAIGQMNFTWNISEYCGGTYKVTGTDVVYPNVLNASDTFVVRDWWNSSWEKRKPIYLSNALSEPKIDMPIYVNITGLGGYIRNCENETRVVSTITGVAVPFNIYGGDNSTYCDIIFIGNISALAINESNYYFYYNNSLASNPNYTQIPLLEMQLMYEDFEDAPWASPLSQVRLATCTTGDNCTRYSPWSDFNGCDNRGTDYFLCSEDSAYAGTAAFQMEDWDTFDAARGLWYTFDPRIACSGQQCFDVKISWYGFYGSLEATEYCRVWARDGTLTNAQLYQCDGGATDCNCEDASTYKGYACNTYATAPLSTLYDPYSATIINNTAINLNAQAIEIHLGAKSNNAGDLCWWDNFNITGYHLWSANVTSFSGDFQEFFTCDAFDIAAPNTTISSPVDYYNTTNATPVVNFTLIDDIDIALSYFIYVDGRRNGQNGSAVNGTPVILELNSLSQGNHTYRIEAADAFNNKLNSTIKNLIVDYNGPNVLFGYPRNFTNISVNEIIINATANDSYTDVDTVFFYYKENQTNDSVLICEDGREPYQCTWNTTLLPDGRNYQLIAIANDTVGNIGANHTLYNITIDRQGPVILIDYPQANGNITYQTMIVNATVNDNNSQIGAVRFYYRFNSTSALSQICIDTTYPYQCSFSTIPLSEGMNYEIIAFANDSLGNIGVNDTEISLALDKFIPTVKNITITPNPQKLGYSVIISANVTDSLGVDGVNAIIALPNASVYEIALLDDDFDSIYSGIFDGNILIGIYNVTIYAIDILEKINSTEKASYIVQPQDSYLFTDKEDYIEGETVRIIAGGFSSQSNINITLYNTTFDIVSGYPKTIISNLTGDITDTWLVPEFSALGQYSLNATDEANTNLSANVSFTIVSSIIESPFQSYQQGDIITFIGYNWEPDSNVTINITNNENSIIFGPLNYTANATGYFNFTWQSLYNLSSGAYKIYAIDADIGLKNDDFTFTIENRSVEIFADYSWYKEGDNITISGHGFSSDSVILLDIYDSSFNRLPSYPKEILSNSTGSINDSLLVLEFGISNYTINATDTNYSNLFNTSVFSIVRQELSKNKDSYVVGETVYFTGAYWKRNSKITLNITNSTGQNISGYPKNVTATADGAITDLWLTRVSSQNVAEYNLSAYNPNDRKENISIGFTVLRIATLDTNLDEYDQSNTINITGNYYTASGIGRLLISTINRSLFAGFFPKNILFNNEGSINHIFNTSDICEGEYFIQSFDDTVSSLNANATFNVTHLYQNTSAHNAAESAKEQSYNIAGGSVSSTSSLDNVYEYIGGADYATNFQGFINYTFNLSATGIDVPRIQNFSITMDYCHSGAQLNPLCGAGLPHEGATTGSQDFMIYNFSASVWQNMTSLPVSDSSDARRRFELKINRSFNDFISNYTVKIRIKLNFTQAGFSDDALLIDYLAINVTHKSHLSKPCTPFTDKYLSLRNLRPDLSAYSPRVFIKNATGTILDNVTGDYFRYITLPNISVLSIFSLSKGVLNYEIFNISMSAPVNLTPVISENYSFSLPQNIINITPLISINDSLINYTKASLAIPKSGLDVNTIMHCTDFNFSNGVCNIFELNETSEYPFYENTTHFLINVTGFDSFGGGAGRTLPNITSISVYNVTGNIDSHTGGTFVSQGLNTTFTLIPGNTYRMEFAIYNSGRRWALASNDQIYHRGLNSSWGLNASGDIWYRLSDGTNRSSGNFSNGNVTWNASKGGFLNAGATGYFYYVVNISVNHSARYPVYFYLNDTSYASGSTDASIFNLPDTITPYAIINYPQNHLNISRSFINFNWTPIDDLSSNLTCNLTIDGTTNATIISQRNLAVNYTISGFNEGGHFWNVSCFDLSNNTNATQTYNFTIDLAGPQTNITNPVNYTNITQNTFVLSATAIDSLLNVDTVKFYYKILSNSSWEFACSDNRQPYSCTWNLALVPDGLNYEVMANANDTVGNIGANSTAYNITIDRKGPHHVEININDDNVSVRINWTSALDADSYSIYTTTNYSQGFSDTPETSEITDLNWTDSTGISQKKYYLVAAVRGGQTGNATEIAGIQTLEIDIGWNLISIPFNLSNWLLYNGTNNGVDIFTYPDNCILSLWRYNSSDKAFERLDHSADEWHRGVGSYEFKTLGPQKGYWAEADSVCNVSFAGIVPIYNLTAPLIMEWNVVGWHSARIPQLYNESSLNPIDVSPQHSVTTIVKYDNIADLFEAAFRVYYPGYGAWWLPSFSLKPFEGYYFEAAQNGTWTIDPNKGT
ncbi:MAG: Ig-like domain-containing protein [archaeon]